MYFTGQHVAFYLALLEAGLYFLRCVWHDGGGAEMAEAENTPPAAGRENALFDPIPFCLTGERMTAQSGGGAVCT